jgi:hypothetical protein
VLTSHPSFTVGEPPPSFRDGLEGSPNVDVPDTHTLGCGVSSGGEGSGGRGGGVKDRESGDAGKSGGAVDGRVSGYGLGTK